MQFHPISVLIPLSCPSASRQSPGADDSTQPGNGTVAAADTLAVINLYVSRVRSSMSWIKTPADLIGRHAVYDCNSLVCAGGRWVGYSWRRSYAWFPTFHHSIAALPLCRCRCYLPLQRNGHSVAIGSTSIFAVLPYGDNQ